MAKRPLKSRVSSNETSAVRDMLERGLASHQIGDLAKAETWYRRILQVEPDNFDALDLLGIIEGRRGRHDEAHRLFSLALSINSRSARAYSHLGMALGALERFEEALESFDKALEITPDSAEAIFNRGVALGNLKRHEEAIASFDSVLAAKPDHAGAMFNRGAALKNLQRHEEAFASFDRAVTIKPDFIEAMVNRGAALADLKRYDEALKSFDMALSAKPDYADAMFCRGELLQRLDRHQEAITDFAALVRVDPHNKYAAGYLHYSKMNCCDWAAFAENATHLVADFLAGKSSPAAFAFLAISGSASEQLLCSQKWLHDKIPILPAPICRDARYRHDKIRLAYLSADFHDHATAYLMAELFERHDKDRFELTAISFGPDSSSEIRKRLARSFDRFVDYVLADRFVIPEDHHSFYAEKVVYLPDTYQPNDTKRHISERVPTRAEIGLPEAGFVFCSFNNSYKITPTIFDIWMRLLRRIDGSVLWLLASNPAVTSNLRSEAAARDIAPERLVFAPRTKLDDHLARHRVADLFLDTLPYNAHTTASDALWAGLPVLTCAGKTFAGRVAGSLLNAVGLPELVTNSLEEYEGLALTLATDAALLADVRAKLARNRATHPLFDTERFRRHLEIAYQTMWRRHEAGEPPTSFAVGPIDR